MSHKSFWLGLDVWFVVVTLLYWALVFLGFGYQMTVNSSVGEWWANLLGLFVPIGPNNLALLMSNFLLPVFGSGELDYASIFKAITGVLVVVGVVIFGEQLLKKHSLRPSVKGIFNLIALLGLTLLVDLLLTGKWTSLLLLQDSLK